MIGCEFLATTPKAAMPQRKGLLHLAIVSKPQGREILSVRAPCGWSVNPPKIRQIDRYQQMANLYGFILPKTDFEGLSLIQGNLSEIENTLTKYYKYQMNQYEGIGNANK